MTTHSGKRTRKNVRSGFAAALRRQRKVVWGLVALLAAVVALTAVPVVVQAGVQPPPAQEGFVPVTDVPPEEQLPAAPLVIAAYAIAWVIVVAYLWSIWRRLTRVEQELAAVSRRLDTGAGG